MHLGLAATAGDFVADLTPLRADAACERNSEANGGAGLAGSPPGTEAIRRAATGVSSLQGKASRRGGT
jgi:hypothetical protein